GGDSGGDRPDVGVALLDRDDAGADEDDAERGADEALRRPVGERGADDHTGDRADEDVAGEAEVDVAANPVGDRGGAWQDGGVDDVGADAFLRREPVDGDRQDRDHGARPGRGDPDHEAGGGADRDRRQLVAGLDLEAVALVDQVAQDQGPHQGDHADHQQG